ncbi:MAG: DUF1499 domain-containing protein [Pseudodesulfovibrio sp.]|nr:DUF1499 domain-containing protein [Pseudodesulfovibrio sp.]
MKYNIFSFMVITVSTVLVLTACSSKAPDNLGMQDGHFALCPDSPNCVSSEATDDKHKVAPIVMNGSEDKVMVDLANTIESMFGGKVIEVKGPYLYAEYTSRIMRFIDDLECYYDIEKALIQIRSASRIGYSDLGANRKRVEELRKLLTGTK